MASLTEQLANVDRSDVIRDTETLIDEEVARKSGVTGLALKGGYKVVKKLKGGRMISFAIDKLLDDFTEALDPVYTSFLDSDETTFEKYIGGHTDTAADALLDITDKRAERAENRVIQKTYSKLRGTAKNHVVEALPGVGRLIDRHVPRS